MRLSRSGIRLNENEPRYYPFEGKAPKKWDFRGLIPIFSAFRESVSDIQKLGIEADVILFHPYDKGHWGFDNMGRPMMTATCDM